MAIGKLWFKDAYSNIIQDEYESREKFALKSSNIFGVTLSD